MSHLPIKVLAKNITTGERNQKQSYGVLIKGKPLHRRGLVAQRGTRTPISLQRLVPETSASTSSAIWAGSL